MSQCLVADDSLWGDFLLVAAKTLPTLHLMLVFPFLLISNTVSEMLLVNELKCWLFVCTFIVIMDILSRERGNSYYAQFGLQRGN